MEKTIVIDGRDVGFKSTGATPLRYKQQFGRDFFADLMSIASGMEKGKEIDMTKVDFEVFYNISWTFAKTADKAIPDPMSWLDSFDEFPLFEILPELQDMLMATVQSKKK